MPLWRRNLFICALGAFLTSAGLSQIAPVLPLYLKSLGVETTQETVLWSGLALGVTYMVVALTSPIWGRLADKKGRKLMLLRSSLGMVFTNLFAANVTTAFQFLSVRMLQGLVSGFYPAAVTLISAVTPSKHTGQAMGILSAMTIGGSLLGPVLGGYLADIIGLRGMFYSIAIFLFIVYLLIQFFVKEDFKPVENAQEKQKFSYIWTHLTHKKNIIALAVSTFLMALTSMALLPVLTLFIQGLLPQDASNIAFLSGLVFSLTGLATMISSTPFGMLADRIGPNRIIIGALIYSSIFTVPQAYASDITELIAVRFVLGLGIGGLGTAINTALSNACPSEYKGQIFSYNQSAQYFGLFLGSITGALISSYFSYVAVFWFISIVNLLNAIWLYFMIGLKSASIKES